MRYIARIAVLAGALLLAACGGAPGTGAPSASQATPAPTSQPTPAAEPTARPTPVGVIIPASGTLLVYHKSGGIMGMDDTLTVRLDGALTLQTRQPQAKSAQIDPAELQPLLALLASPDLALLQPRYEAMGADLFTYEIRLGEQAQPLVVTMDGADAPAILGQLIELLEQLRSKVL